MKTIEKIRQKIEELYDGEAPKHDQQCDFSDGYFTGLSVISNFLDTLSGEPDKSLEEYASRAGFDYVDGIVQEEPGHRWNDHDVEFAYRDGIIAGADWQARQLLQGSPMPEDTVLFNKGVAEGRRLEREDSVECEVTDVGLNYLDLALFEAERLGLNKGDKVKVIVLKEDN